MQKNQGELKSPRAILCIDFDGTLIDEQVRIHPQDVNILSAFPKQYQPVMTTGRDLPSVKSIFQEHVLFNEILFPMPGVFMNGGITYLPGEVLSDQHPFSPEIRLDVIDLANRFPKTAFSFFAVDGIYLVNANRFGRHISVSHHLGATEIDSAEVPDEIIKIVVLEPVPQKMAQVKQHSQQLEAEFAVTLPYAYEINPSGIHKAASLKSLLNLMRINGRPIYVVGDSQNDLSLFELAKLRFAPDSAQSMVKEKADVVINREIAGLLAPILNHIYSL
jgi:Cof subfamily protein (haloacid dehalogenase superfamily)